MTSCCSGSHPAPARREPSERTVAPELTMSPAAGAGLADMARTLAAVGLPTEDLEAPGRFLFRFSGPDGSTAGYGGFELHGAEALLRSVVVPPSHRGRGYGEAIVRALLAAAKNRGATSAWLLTTTAAEFFAGLGFSRGDRREAPPSIAGTKEFSSLCPASATVMRMPLDSDQRLPVAIIGGGPVGLAAAAHLLERGLEPLVLEAGPSVGTAPKDWGHVHMFSPWRYNIDRAARALLERHGWTAPDPETFPTGREFVEDYLAPLAALPELAPRIRLNTRVTGVARVPAGKVRNAGREHQPFEVRFEDAEGKEGRYLARAVIAASGTWGNPAAAGSSGLPALGERAAAKHIRYGMPDVLGVDCVRYGRKRVLVVGSGHSAIGTLIDLATLAEQVPGTTVLWAARSTDLTRAYGGGAADQLPERGALGQRLRRLVEGGRIELLAPFSVDEVRRGAGDSLQVLSAEGRTVQADEMVVATGLRPDLGILREVRLDLDPALECPRVLAPLIDPNLHSCGTVRPHGAEELAQPDTGLFLAGMLSYGRAPTFLLATGYEQVRSIAAFLAGDLEAARRVELDLPETGVCSANRVLPEAADAVSSCCTPVTPQGSCCPPKPQLAEDAPCCGGAGSKEIARGEQEAADSASSCRTPKPELPKDAPCCGSTARKESAQVEPAE